MAKIVIAGCCDCPYYAKVELLGDLIVQSVPNFHLHKIVKTRKEWPDWIHEIAKFNNWTVKESPIIWRELVDRGGKGHLIGGPNEFQEYIYCYYNIKSDLTSGYMAHVVKDNTRFKEEEDLETQTFKSMSSPVKICICGASNNSIGHLIYAFGDGEILGEDTEISFIFHDESDKQVELKSLQLATFDLACTLIRSVSITDDLIAAIVDCSIVIIYESTDPISEITDYIDYYHILGSIIDRYSPFHVRVLVVPTKIDSSISLIVSALHRNLDRIPKFCVVGLATLLERQTAAVLAKKLNVNSANVSDIIIWGDYGGKKFIDVSNARVRKYDGSIVGPDPFRVKVTDAIWDKKWLNQSMEQEVLSRFERISNLREGSQANALSLAHSIKQLLQLWLNGDPHGRIFSLVCSASDGSYGLSAGPTANGLVACLPVTMSTSGYWSLVDNIEISEQQFQRIKECHEELLEYFAQVFPQDTNNASDEPLLDEIFIETQIKSMLEEDYKEKAQINEIWNQLKDFLSVEERLEVSKNKQLLLRTIEDLTKSQEDQKQEANNNVAMVTDQVPVEEKEDIDGNNDADNNDKGEPMETATTPQENENLEEEDEEKEEEEEEPIEE